MVDQVAVATATSPASAGSTMDLTSPLITATCEAAILIFSRMTDEDSSVVCGMLGMGFVSFEGDGGGNQNGCRTITLRDAITTTTQTFHSNSVGATSKCIQATDAVGTAITVEATVTSQIAGGLRLTFGTVTAGQQIRVTALLFAGIARSSRGTGTCTTAGNTHEDVGLSGTLFQPDLLIFGGTDGSLAIASDDGTPNVGFAVRSPLQQVMAYLNIARVSDPTYADGFLRTDSFCGAFNTGAGNPPTNTVERGVISSFDSTGFNADCFGATPHNFQYLAIKWTNTSRVRVGCANMPIAASTGLQSFNSLGFTPDVVLGMSSMLTAVDTQSGDTVNACGAGYFLTGKTGSYSHAAGHDHSVVTVGDPTVAKSRQGAHALLTLDDLSAVTHQAEWVGGSGAGGFVLNFTTAAKAGYMTALGIQIIPGPPPGGAEQGIAPAQRERRARQRPTIGGARHAGINWLKDVLANRRAALRRVRAAPELGGKFTPPVPGVQLDDANLVGDNALAGSERGSNALAGSAQGDS